MKKNFIVSTLLFFMLSISFSSLQAQDYNSAIGGRLGTFLNVSYKTFLTENTAVEGIAGFTTDNLNFFNVGALYQIHNSFPEVDDLNWYYGGGGGLLLGDDFLGIAIYGTIGLEYTMPESPVCFFVDALPAILLGDGDNFGIEGSIGARYILNR